MPRYVDAFENELPLITEHQELGAFSRQGRIRVTGPPAGGETLIPRILFLKKTVRGVKKKKAFEYVIKLIFKDTELKQYHKRYVHGELGVLMGRRCDTWADNLGIVLGTFFPLRLCN